MNDSGLILPPGLIRSGTKPTGAEWASNGGRALISPIDMHRALKRKDIELSSAGDKIVNPVSGLDGVATTLDLEWLPFAAKVYNISPDIRDYLLIPTVIMPAGFPNRNNCGFLLEDLVKFSTDYGCQYMKTWRGKPTFHEHDNENPLKASGVQLDVFASKAKNGNYWKIINFMAFDRSKYSERCRQLASGEIDSFSMGAYVTGGYECSICNRKLGTCLHQNKKKPQDMRVIDTGKDRPEVAFRVGRLPVGFECSTVEVPAFSVAQSDMREVQYLG